MKYVATLTIKGQVVGTSQFDHRGQMTVTEIVALGDKLYFGYIDGPSGLSFYPSADLIITSPTAQTVRFQRRDGFNAAGLSRLWKELPLTPTS